MGVILAVIATVFLHQPVQAYDFKGCQNCHEVLLGEMFRTYLHLPFLQQRCRECHAADEFATQAKKRASLGQKNRFKIQWLGESFMADTSHGFVLPPDSIENALIVELQGSEGTFSRQQIKVPPLANLPEVQDPGKPPVISGVRVLKVQRGVFLSATIGWQTDTLTDAQVRFGNEELSQTSRLGNRLGRWHEVVLHKLKPDKTYRFSVISKDLFGRSQTSEPATFSTFTPSSVPRPPISRIPPQNGEIVSLASNFRRLGTDYLVELMLEQPALVHIGAGKGTWKPHSGVTGVDDKFHAGLSSKKVASIDACRNCHTNQATATHPVNVYPKPGMVIPPEYPTLPDGRITCRSCHESHSSDYENLTIKRGKRELCLGCHPDMM